MKRFLKYLVSPATLLSLVLSCQAPDPEANQPERDEEPAPPIPEKYNKFGTSLDITINLPKGATGYGVVAGERDLYFFSGLDDLRAQNDLTIFSHSERTFKKIETTLSPRFLPVGSSLLDARGREYVFFFGGSEFVEVTKSRGQRLSDGLLVTRFEGEVSVKAVASANAPTARDGHCVLAVGSGRFAVLTGDNSGVYSRDISFFDPAHLQYEIREGQLAAQTGSLPIGRSEAICLYDAKAGEIVLYGGFNEAVGQIDDLWRYNVTESRWRQIKLTGSVGAREAARKVKPVFFLEQVVDLDSALKTKWSGRGLFLAYGNRHNALDPWLVYVDTATGEVTGRTFLIGGLTLDGDSSQARGELTAGLSGYSDLSVSLNFPSEPKLHDAKLYPLGGNIHGFKGRHGGKESLLRLYFMNFVKLEDPGSAAIDGGVWASTEDASLAGTGDHLYPVGNDGVLLWGVSLTTGAAGEAVSGRIARFLEFQR